MNIAEIQKNAAETLVVGLGEYLGHKVVNVRIHVEGAEGQLIPTKKGVTASVRLLGPLIDALQEAKRLADGEEKSHAA